MNKLSVSIKKAMRRDVDIAVVVWTMQGQPSWKDLIDEAVGMTDEDTDALADMIDDLENDLVSD